MRYKVFGLCLVLFLSVATINLAAQSEHAPFKVQIPIDFVVNDKSYPAGEYTVAPQNTDWETLVGPAGRIVAFAPATLRGEAGSNNLLVFHQVGDQYYLAELWTGGNRSGRAINQRSLENRKHERIVARAVTVVSGGGTRMMTK